jgi:hypothetical protein
MRTVRGQVVVACPFSVAIEFAENYVSRRTWSGGGRLLRLWAPLVPARGRVALGWTVYAHATTGRDHTDAARRHEAMWIRLRPASGLPFPHVAAALTARPHQGRTLLHLAAEYVPPFGMVGAAFDSLIGKWLAERALLGFLSEMKLSIEAQHEEFLRAYGGALDKEGETRYHPIT